MSAKRSTVLTGSQDLLTYFNLIPIYNKVVKPFPPTNRTEGIDPTLFPYISDLPGKLDFEPDGYLLNLLRDPQAVESGPEIKPLDSDTLRDAFSLKEGPVPGFDASILGTDENGYGGYTPNSAQYNGENYSAELDHNGERRHKKKKKKRRHGHEHDEEGHAHSDHKKKKKKKRDKERRDEFNDEPSAHYYVES